MSGMEPDVKDFLKKVAQSFFLGLLWMMLNMTIGIFLGWMFIHDKIAAGNIIFYIFMVASLAALIWFYYRTWKKKFPHG
jgi:hypothetical protein